MCDNKNKVIDIISKMSTIEMSELISMIEKKFSISNYDKGIISSNEKSNSVIKEKEEKNEFKILLKSIGKNKIAIIKLIRSITNLGLKESKDLVDSFPVIIKEKLNKEESIKIKKMFEDSGSEIDII